MTPSKILFYICVSFVIGIFLESLVIIPQIFVWGILFLGVLAIFASFFTLSPKIRSFGFLETIKNDQIAVVGFCILFLVLGIVRLQISNTNIQNDLLKKLNDLPNKIILTGQIIDGPDIRDSSQKLKVKIDKVESIVLATVNRYPAYDYLDKIKITGMLKTPGVFDGFNYTDYLLKDEIYSVMDFPKVELISKQHNYNIFTLLYSKILVFKEKLRSSILANFSSPQNYILEGIVLGNNKTMTQDLRDKLNGTGLRYLTAISGVHVLIVSAILMSLLLALGLWRGQAFYFAIIFIWLYIILTGFPASGVRAAIMGSVFLLAQKLGRQNTSGRVIVFTAALMLIQNPLLLWYDVGFQLSFLASMGIIYLKPIIDIAIKTLTKEKLKYFSDILSITLTAQLATVPIMVYNFGIISLIAPVTNLLVVPVVYFLILFGFLASILGIISGFLGWVFSIPCWLLLTYFLKVMDIFYQPWAIKEIQNVSWIWLALYYLIVSVLIWFLQKKLKPKFLGY